MKVIHKWCPSFRPCNFESNLSLEAEVIVRGISEYHLWNNIPMLIVLTTHGIGCAFRGTRVLNNKLYWVTNKHVLSCEDLQTRNFKLFDMRGEPVEAVDLAYSSKSDTSDPDLAVIFTSIGPENMTLLHDNDKENKFGTLVSTMYFKFEVKNEKLIHAYFKKAVGRIVEQISIGDHLKIIYHTSKIIPGASGSALIDEHNSAIGLNFGQEIDTEASLAFASGLMIKLANAFRSGKNFHGWDRYPPISDGSPPIQLYPPIPKQESQFPFGVNYTPFRFRSIKELSEALDPENPTFRVSDSSLQVLSYMTGVADNHDRGNLLIIMFIPKGPLKRKSLIYSDDDDDTEGEEAEDYTVNGVGKNKPLPKLSKYDKSLSLSVDDDDSDDDDDNDDQSTNDHDEENDESHERVSVHFHLDKYLEPTVPNYSHLKNEPQFESVDDFARSLLSVAFRQDYNDSLSDKSDGIDAVGDEGKGVRLAWSQHFPKVKLTLEEQIEKLSTNDRKIWRDVDANHLSPNLGRIYKDIVTKAFELFQGFQKGEPWFELKPNPRTGQLFFGR